VTGIWGTVGSRPLDERNPGFGLVPIKWAPKAFGGPLCFFVLVGPAAIPARGRPIPTRALLGPGHVRYEPTHSIFVFSTPSFLPSFRAPQLRTRNTHGANVTKVPYPKVSFVIN
jgi:hypothetical protein